MNTIRVLLVDDHSIVRAGLRALLETAGDMQIIGEAENGRQAVHETKRLRPQVVLMDFAMPLLNGVEAARQIALEVATARVLMLSSYSDDLHLRQAVSAGVAGFLTKESAAADLLEAIRETHKGGAFFSPRLLYQLLMEWRKEEAAGGNGTTQAPTLPMRQAQVLQLVAEGYANKQIAELLSVSKKTVEKHRQALMVKLDCHNTARLTGYAVASGAVEVRSIPNSAPSWPASGSRWSGESTVPNRRADK
jgi:DNA-binding NarL/FixJ family response regulator